MSQRRHEIQYRIASEPWEFVQIHRLNYRTFVEEIPQHPPNPTRLRIDPYHDENTYVIALNQDELVGMVALRAKRPFSLDRKLATLDSYLPPHRSLCEVRLLSVAPEGRKTSIFRALIDRLIALAIREGHDLAVVSGTLTQERLYRHLGFVPFGPIVASGDALYQPMYLQLEALLRHSRLFPALRDLSESSCDTVRPSSP